MNENTFICPHCKKIFRFPFPELKHACPMGMTSVRANLKEEIDGVEDYPSQHYIYLSPVQMKKIPND